MQFIFIILLIVMVAFLLKGIATKKALPVSLPVNLKALLQQEVAFYRKLGETEKKQFENKVASFLSTISIEGINTKVDDLDKVLIGASAIIPICAFEGWQYPNLTNVLLYPEHFNESFDMKDNDRPVMGMVGNGAMNHKMILSKPALREGFSNETDKHNTAIHEFVHLLDNLDGSTDGIPEALLQKQYTIPWINLMHENIKAIIAKRSDINPYGATSKTEFFAVTAEYFFERPDLFKTKHPQLFEMMEEIFRQYPAAKS